NAHDGYRNGPNPSPSVGSRARAARRHRKRRNTRPNRLRRAAGVVVMGGGAAGLRRRGTAGNRVGQDHGTDEAAPAVAAATAMGRADEGWAGQIRVVGALF